MRAVEGSLDRSLQWMLGERMRAAWSSSCSRNALAGFSCLFRFFGFSGSGNQINEINQTNQTNQTDQMNELSFAAQGLVVLTSRVIRSNPAIGYTLSAIGSDFDHELSLPSDRLVSCRRLGEFEFQGIDPGQVDAHVVVAAPLAGSQPEPA